MAKRFVVACGGTGGHTFPGLAVARELRARGHEVVVWSSGRAIEKSVMAAWDGEVFSTGARPLRPRFLFTNLLAWWRCRREMRRFRPQALLAMGSYSSLPPVLAARAYGVPVVLHEANTVPGRAVEWLARYARKVAVSFEETRARLAGRDTVRTGLPVRAEIAAPADRFAEIPANAFCVFVTGGSQGAHRVNELVAQTMPLVQRDLVRRDCAKTLFVLHQTGSADEEYVRGCYAAASVAARVVAFEPEMSRAFASADLVVARAGASTCFELASVAKPTFFIPLPGAVRNHQHFNAQAFVQQGAADEGAQDALTPRALANYILHRIEDPADLVRKTSAMRRLATPDAAARVADLVEEVAKNT